MTEEEPGTAQPAGRWHLLLPLFWAGGAAAAAARVDGRAADDFFITYRYAWNLAHGAGFVFNPGERVFGTTDPGFGLLLAPLHALTGVPVHQLAGWLFALGVWALALLLWQEGRAQGTRWESAIGGSLWVGASYLWANSGSAEPFVLTGLGAAALLAPRRPVLAGLLAGLTVWFRPDALLGVGILGLLLWHRERRLPWRFGAAAGAVVAAGFAAAWVYFGSPLPNTLAGKRIMAGARENAYAGPLRFWLRATEILPRHWGEGWKLAAAGSLMGIVPWLLRGGLAARTVALYGVAVGVAYPLLGVPFFPWYILPVLAAGCWGLAAAASAVGRGVAGWWPASWLPRGRVVGGVAAALTLALPLASQVPAAARWFAGFAGFPRYEAYARAGEWIRANTPPEARIAFAEVGVIAYTSERPVDDLLGLVTPRSLPFVAAGDPFGAFLARPPEIFLHHRRGPGGEILAAPWFAQAYEEAVTLDGPDGEPVRVFRRRPGVELPAP